MASANKHTLPYTEIAKEGNAHLHENIISFRNLANSLPHFIWQTAPDGTPIFTSDRWEIFTGIDPSRAENFEKIVHPEDFEGIMSAWQYARENGTSYKYEVRIRCQAGNYHWFHVHGEPVKNDNGEIIFWSGAFTNISELKDARNFSKSIIEASPALIYIYNLKEHRNIYISGQVENILGFKVKEIRNMGSSVLSQLVHPADRETVNQRFQYLIESNDDEVNTCEYRMYHKSGGAVWLSDRARIFKRDENGEPEEILGVTTDISQSKQNELSVRNLNDKLELAINSGRIGIWHADFVHNMLEWTEMQKSLYGLPSTFPINKPEDFKPFVVPEDWDRINALKPHEQDGELEYQFRILRKDGKCRWIQARSTRFTSPEGRLLSIIGTNIDITEEKLSAQRKDDFVKIVSHELKTPLTSIKGYVELMHHALEEITPSMQSLMSTALTRVASQVEKLNNLVSEILDLSRIEMGKIELKKEHFSVQVWIKDILTDLQLIYPSHQFKLDLKEDFIFYGDQNRLSQVLINLINNGVKYSPGKLDIYVSIANLNGDLKVSVRDEGIGICETEQQRIFEKFYRVEGTHEHHFAGLGIGLYISAEIIRRHGGNIIVKSQKGVGSEFTFAIPKHQSEKHAP